MLFFLLMRLFIILLLRVKLRCLHPSENGHILRAWER
jgi:hypothetical protein